MNRPEPLSDFGELSHIDAADVRQCARTLLRHPILREGGPKADLLPLVYRGKDVLQPLFSAYLGYELTVERRFARLYKNSDAARGRGITGFSTRAYVYLALTLAALVGIGRQILLSGLIAKVRGAAADAGVPMGKSRAELRAFVQALRYLVQTGVLEETEGTMQSAERHVLDNEFAEALITVDLELLDAFIPPLRDEDPGAQGHGADLPAGLRARRRLVEDPLVLFSDLSADEEQYLRTHAGQEAYWAERYLGMQVEIRAEGMAAIDTEGLLTDVSFPGVSTIARISLLVLPVLLSEAAPDENGLLSVAESHLRAACADLVARYRDTWARNDTANQDTLIARVSDHLLTTGVARPSETGGLLLVPAAYRWDPVPEERGGARENSVDDGADTSAPRHEEPLF